MCATHNISQSTKAVLLRELKRGGDIVDKIFKGQLQWSDLFARNSFFTRDYKYYLSIMPSSTNKEAQSMWSGLVESKLRHLVGALDRRKTAIQLAHPFPQGFERIHKCKSEYEVEAVKNGSTQFQVQADGNPEKTEQIAQDGADNIQTLYTTTYYIGVEIKALPPGTLQYDIKTLLTEDRSASIFGHLSRHGDVQVHMHFVAPVSARRQ